MLCREIGFGVRIASLMAEIPVKIEKICSRLQTLLDQWIDSVPIISEASASTLISQFNLYSTVMKDYPKKEEWALHDMPYLLMQTVSQLWDKEENTMKLIQLGIVNAIHSIYTCLVPVLLSMNRISENRLPEFLSLLSILVSKNWMDDS